MEAGTGIDTWGLPPPARTKPRPPSPPPSFVTPPGRQPYRLVGTAFHRDSRCRGRLEELAVLAGDVGIGCGRPLGRGQQGEGLQGHLSGEQSGTLAFATEPGRTVGFVAAIIVERQTSELRRGRLLGAV